MHTLAETAGKQGTCTEDVEVGATRRTEEDTEEDKEKRTQKRMHRRGHTVEDTQKRTQKRNTEEDAQKMWEWEQAGVAC